MKGYRAMRVNFSPSTRDTNNGSIDFYRSEKCIHSMYYKYINRAMNVKNSRLNVRTGKGKCISNSNYREGSTR